MHPPVGPSSLRYGLARTTCFSPQTPEHRSCVADLLLAPQWEAQSLAACDALLHDLDATMDILRVYRSRVCERRGTFRPIASLPDDLLLAIFEYCSPTCPSTTPHQYESTLWLFHMLPPLLAFSQTCRYWRNLALATPMLWTSLPLHLPGVVPLAVSRARDSDLHINWEAETSPLRTWNSDPVTTLLSALAHKPRIRAISVTECPLRNAHLVQDILRSCSIEGQPGLESLEVRFSDVQELVRLLPMQTAALRHLTLDGCIFHTPCILESLVHLNLRRPFQDTSTHIDQVFLLLQGTPRLRSLALHSIPRGQSTPRVAQSIDLPQLMSLDVQGGLSNIGALVRYLRMDALRSLVLHSFSVLDDPGTLLDLCVMLRKYCLSRWSRISAASIQICPGDDFLTFACSSPNEARSFELTARMSDTGSVRDVLEPMLKLAPMEALSELELCIFSDGEEEENGITSTYLSAMLQRTPRTQLLALHQDAASVFIPALADYVDFCPELGTVVLYDTDLSELVDHETSITVLGSLAVALARRRQSGHQSLQQLTFVDCTRNTMRVTDASDVEDVLGAGAVDRVVVSIVDPDESKPHRGGQDEDWEIGDGQADPSDGGEWPLGEIYADSDDDNDLDWTPDDVMEMDE
jgi:hypothetical protein